MSFTFFDRYYEVTTGMSKPKRDKFLAAVVNYIMASEEPNLDGELQRLFLALKLSLDKARVKQGSNQDFVPRTNSLIALLPTAYDPKKRSETCKHSQVETGRFEEFWRAYPKRVKRKVAEKSWQKLAPDDDLIDTILSAIAAHKATDQWKRDGGAYIPHPSTWLNQRRWEDELDTRLEVQGGYDDGSRFKELPADWKASVKAL